MLEENRSVLGHAYAKVDGLVNSMNNCSAQWALCMKRHVMDLNQHTTSIGESYNSSLKSSNNKPMASLSLANSALTCVQHSETLLKKRQLFNAMNSTKSRNFAFGDLHLNILTPKAQGIIEALVEKKVSSICYFIQLYFSFLIFSLIFFRMTTNALDLICVLGMFGIRIRSKQIQKRMFLQEYRFMPMFIG